MIPGDRRPRYCPEASGETEIKAVTSAKRAVSLQILPFISGFRRKRAAGVMWWGGEKEEELEERSLSSLAQRPGERSQTSLDTEVSNCPNLGLMQPFHFFRKELNIFL